ncbi:DUF368 domain-containing protein [Paenibacillus eucommiae]|uniref:Membrane protein n=1 Tax=Paenibacillus eucommiae TaxID=1355755 RepID=A0ABS4IZ14_9BACL|nr:DUF368 domain-containing protein [Paenibacillus eucommiae]MBP1992096.1 putative membrane protein [Paenibacillus eucommiae]
MKWNNLWRGAMMGVTDIIPGISGGTIAIVLGIYEDTINSINQLFSTSWKKSLSFLIPLGIGLLAAIFSAARVISWLLEVYTQQTYFFFIGLILGIAPYLLQKVSYRTTFKAHHYLILLVSLVIVSVLGTMGERSNEVLEMTSFMDYITLFFIGWIASTALVLPGVSGSFMMLLLGYYETIIHGVKTLDIAIIIAVGIGVAFGIIVTSKLISYLLHRFTTVVYAAVVGLVVGSAYVIFPEIGDSIGGIIASILTFGLGVVIAAVLGRIEYKNA